MFGGSTVGEGLLGDQTPWERFVFVVDAVSKPLSPPPAGYFYVAAAGIRSWRALAGYSLSCP